jgi:hypothetical protein
LKSEREKEADGRFKKRDTELSTRQDGSGRRKREERKRLEPGGK